MSDLEREHARVVLSELRYADKILEKYIGIQHPIRKELEQVILEHQRRYEMFCG